MQLQQELIISRTPRMCTRAVTDHEEDPKIWAVLQVVSSQLHLRTFAEDFK